eukprot:6462693-Amphidinium_carterae.1
METSEYGGLGVNVITQLLQLQDSRAAQQQGRWDQPMDAKGGARCTWSWSFHDSRIHHSALAAKAARSLSWTSKVASQRAASQVPQLDYKAIKQVPQYGDSGGISDQSGSDSNCWPS